MLAKICKLLLYQAKVQSAFPQKEFRRLHARKTRMNQNSEDPRMFVTVASSVSC